MDRTEEGIRGGVVEAGVCLPDNTEKEVSEIVGERHFCTEVGPKHIFGPVVGVLIAVGHTDSREHSDVEE